MRVRALWSQRQGERQGGARALGAGGLERVGEWEERERASELEEFGLERFGAVGHWWEVIESIFLQVEEGGNRVITIVVIPF